MAVKCASKAALLLSYNRPCKMQLLLGSGSLTTLKFCRPLACAISQRAAAKEMEFKAGKAVLSFIPSWNAVSRLVDAF